MKEHIPVWLINFLGGFYGLIHKETQIFLSLRFRIPCRAQPQQTKQALLVFSKLKLPWANSQQLALQPGGDMPLDLRRNSLRCLFYAAEKWRDAFQALPVAEGDLLLFLGQ